MASLVSVFAAMRLTNVPSNLHTLCAMPYLPSIVPQDGTKDGCTMLFSAKWGADTKHGHVFSEKGLPDCF